MSNKEYNLSPVIAGTMKWGLWGKRFSAKEYEELIHFYLEQAITSFDHADIYGDYTTEAEFGVVIKQNSSLRKKIQLITKCGIQKISEQRPHHLIKSYNSSAEHIIASVEQSLKNFGTDYLDWLLLHRPDYLMNVKEVAKAFTDLKEKGKVLHFGVSNFLPSQVSLLHRHFPVEANQIRCSVFHRNAFEDGSFDFCQQESIIPMAWSPLNGGKISEDDDHEAARRVYAVTSIMAESYKVSRDIILLKWLQMHPAKIKPVIGTTNKDRIQSLTQLNHFTLTREEWYMLWRAGTGTEVA
jgi:predicted oxidoreductase